jgi:hypothetical protein
MVTFLIYETVMCRVQQIICHLWKIKCSKWKSLWIHPLKLILCIFWSMFTKTVKSMLASSCLYLCHSIWTKQLGSHQTDFHFSLCWGVLLKSQFLLKLDKSNGLYVKTQMWCVFFKSILLSPTTLKRARWSCNGSETMAISFIYFTAL